MFTPRESWFEWTKSLSQQKVEDLNRWEARAVYFERLIFFTIFAAWRHWTWQHHAAPRWTAWILTYSNCAEVTVVAAIMEQLC